MQMGSRWAADADADGVIINTGWADQNTQVIQKGCSVKSKQPKQGDKNRDERGGEEDGDDDGNENDEKFASSLSASGSSSSCSSCSPVTICF